MTRLAIAPHLHSNQAQPDRTNEMPELLLLLLAAHHSQTHNDKLRPQRHSSARKLRAPTMLAPTDRQTCRDSIRPFLASSSTFALLMESLEYP